MPPVSTDPALASLEVVALKAGRTLDRSIELLPQHDAAIGWKAAATHPLQPLEVEYQGIVRDAVRDLRDVERRKEIESALLGDFFFLDAGAPRLLGVREGQPYGGQAFPLPQDRLREARSQLDAAKRLVVAPGATIDGNVLRAHLQQAWDGAASVLAGFLTFPNSTSWPVPPVQKAVSRYAERTFERKLKNAGHFERHDPATEEGRRRLRKKQSSIHLPTNRHDNPHPLCHQ